MYLKQSVNIALKRSLGQGNVFYTSLSVILITGGAVKGMKGGEIGCGKRGCGEGCGGKGVW